MRSDILLIGLEVARIEPLIGESIDLVQGPEALSNWQYAVDIQDDIDERLVVVGGELNASLLPINLWFERRPEYDYYELCKRNYGPCNLGGNRVECLFVRHPCPSLWTFDVEKIEARLFWNSLNWCEEHGWGKHYCPICLAI